MTSKADEQLAEEIMLANSFDSCLMSQDRQKFKDKLAAALRQARIEERERCAFVAENFDSFKAEAIAQAILRLL
jgi:hypothetical protein